MLLLIGMVNAPLPFKGDQALFAVGGQAMSHGAVLYRDFWDLKQPGIYGFYLLGGTMFGFSEFGLHLWELLYFAAFAILLRVTLSSVLRHPLAARVGPLFVIGVYFAGARPYDVGQIEVLVGLPLYVALVCAERAETDGAHRASWLVAFGLAVGFVGLFKHLYVLIPLAWLLRTLWRLHRTGRSGTVMASALAAVTAGLAAVLLPIAAYFVLNGQVERIWWTYFEYSPRITELDPRPLTRLVTGIGRLGLIYAPLFVLAVVTLLPPRGTRQTRLVGDLLSWLALGLLLVLTQSWWSYHFMLLLTPVALLGVLGLDRLLDRGTPLPARRLAVLVVSVSLPLLVFFGDKVVAEAREGFGSSAAGREQIWRHFEPTYEQAGTELQFLRQPGAMEGAIYVFGNPLYIFLSGREQAIAINGWSPEFHDQDTWGEVLRTLTAAKPPYIFAEAGYRELVAARSPELAAFLATEYTVVRANSVGTWYRRL